MQVLLKNETSEVIVEASALLAGILHEKARSAIG
jgi:hypothetical protein